MSLSTSSRISEAGFLIDPVLNGELDSKNSDAIPGLHLTGDLSGVVDRRAGFWRAVNVSDVLKIAADIYQNPHLTTPAGDCQRQAEYLTTNPAMGANCIRLSEACSCE